MTTESCPIDAPARLGGDELAGGEAPSSPGETRIAIYVYSRTTLELRCAGPICLSAFLGPVPDVYFDAGPHAISIEPGVYLARAAHEVEVGGGDLDAVAIVDGKPARRTPRRLAKALPSIRRRELARFLRRPPEPRPQRVIRRVLVIDEDQATTSRYARGFGPGRTVLAAADPAAARELARSGPPCDLVIVELRIGGESGIALAHELKRERPELLVALCSGYLSVEVAIAAVRAGIDVVLFKPVTAQEILRRLGAAAGEPEPEPEIETLEHAEWEHISRVLADCNGNISLTASRLGIYRSSLQRRLRRFGVPCAERGLGARSPSIALSRS